MIRRIGISMPDVLLLTLLMGVLAAIIIPDISGVGPRSRSSTLARDLRTVRSRIERYKRHHNGELPAAKGANFGDFLCRMAGKTDADGDSGVEFALYSRRLPSNPFNGLNTVRVDGAAAGANIAGWRFDACSGAFQADDSAEHAMF